MLCQINTPDIASYPALHTSHNISAANPKYDPAFQPVSFEVLEIAAYCSPRTWNIKYHPSQPGFEKNDTIPEYHHALHIPNTGVVFYLSVPVLNLSLCTIHHKSAHK